MLLVLKRRRILLMQLRVVLRFAIAKSYKKGVETRYVYDFDDGKKIKGDVGGYISFLTKDPVIQTETEIANLYQAGEKLDQADKLVNEVIQYLSTEEQKINQEAENAAAAEAADAEAKAAADAEAEAARIAAAKAAEEKAAAEAARIAEAAAKAEEREEAAAAEAPNAVGGCRWTRAGASAAAAASASGRQRVRMR